MIELAYSLLIFVIIYLVFDAVNWYIGYRRDISDD